MRQRKLQQQPYQKVNTATAAGDERQPIEIRDLSTAMGRASWLEAIVLAKSDVKRKNQPKNAGDDNQNDPSSTMSQVRAVFSVTIRDHSGVWINCSFEAQAAKLLPCFDLVHVGDILSLKGFNVVLKSSSRSFADYLPDTNSECHLVGDLDQEFVTYEVKQPNQHSDMLSLLNLITKDSNNYYALRDLNTDPGQGSDNEGRMVNALVVVKKIGQTREITTKFGTVVKKRDLFVYDQSCAKFLINLWGDELCFLAECWAPHDTILFIADMKLSLDKYKNIMVGNTSPKSLITQNPDTREGQNLHRFAQKTQSKISGIEEDNEADEKEYEDLASKASEVMTVEDIKSLKINASQSDLESYQICTCFGYFSCLNIDLSTSRVVCKVCTVCKRKIDANSVRCSNFDCIQSGIDSKGSENAQFYRYSCSTVISDHTGSLEGCFFANKSLETLTTYSAEEFNKLDFAQRNMIKSDIAFEMMKIILKIEPVMNKKGYAIKILKCEQASYKEYLEHISDKKH